MRLPTSHGYAETAWLRGSCVPEMPGNARRVRTPVPTSESGRLRGRGFALCPRPSTTAAVAAQAPSRRRRSAARAEASIDASGGRRVRPAMRLLIDGAHPPVFRAQSVNGRGADTGCDARHAPADEGLAAPQKGISSCAIKVVSLSAVRLQRLVVGVLAAPAFLGTGSVGSAQVPLQRIVSTSGVPHADVAANFSSALLSGARACHWV